MRNNVDFSKDLIKGKIAEIVFEQMFRQTEQYTILRFGYEYTEPVLSQYRHLLRVPETLDNIDSSPDFILLTEDKSRVYLVEVKYRSWYEEKEILKIATKLADRWHSPYLFLATPRGFYFEPCNTIIKNRGKIGHLFESKVSKELQEKYLAILNEFIKT